MRKEHGWHERIPDENLRQLAESQSSDAFVSVIIEPDLPDKKVLFGRKLRKGRRTPTPIRIERLSTVQEAQVREHIAETEEFLRGVVGKSVNYLKAAQAFVVKVNGPQLRTLASSPLLKCIRPNRTLKR